MKFKKYPSLENTYREKFISDIKEQGKAAGVWHVAEKCHGSNFSFISDGAQLEVARRTDILKDGDKFYSYNNMVDRYSDKIMSLVNDVIASYADIKEVTVFGELFGGHYPHKDVAKSNESSIQKGVFYHPEEHFYGFDILIRNSDDNERFLDVEEMSTFFDKHNLIYAKTLFSGTLQECLDYPNTFQTTIPAMFGLPEIDDNVCEGVVIKPVTGKRVYNQRIVLKNKNEKWKEKASEPKVKKEKQVDYVMSEEENSVYEKVLLFVTTQRIDAVLSKMLTPTQKDFGKIIGLYAKDVFDDFLEEYNDDYMKLNSVSRSAINKQVGKDCVKFLKENLLRKL